MPHNHDLEDDTAQFASTFECLRCGNIVESRTHPGTCAECGGDFQNRAKSLE